MRIFNTYGPRMRPNDGRAIPTFIRQALPGEPITVAGDGSQTRSVCYVDDLVEGILAAAAVRHAGPINIGNPHELTVLAAGRVRSASSPGRRARSSSSRGRRTTRPSASPTSRCAEALLGWEPEVAVEDGLKRTIAWFRDHPELI